MLPGVERGQVEGLYYVPIIYPIIVGVLIVAGAIALMWFSAKYPYEGNREQPNTTTIQTERSSDK